MRITALKPGVTTEYGIPVPVSTIATVGDEYGKSLVLSLNAADTDGVLPGIPNTPFLPFPDSSASGAVSVSAVQSARAARIAARAKGPAIVAAAWAPTTAYTALQVRRLPIGHHVVCETGGPSGATAPLVDAGRPITDGSVTWRYANFNKTASDAIVPTVTTAASAAAAGLTETRFHTPTAATQFLTGRNGIAVSRFDALVSGFGAAVGPAAGSANGTAEASAYGLTGEVFSRAGLEFEFYVTDTHVTVTHHNTSGKFWVEIDGQPVEADATIHNGTSGGLVKFDYGLYARRHVRINQLGNDIQVRGVALSTNGRVEAAATLGDTMLYFGDSFGNTVTPSTFTMPHLSGIIIALRRALGVESIIDMSVGGSGYVSQNANTYNVPAMLVSPGNNTLFGIYNPTHVIIAAGFNDRDNGNRSLVISEARRTWGLARAKFPTARITIVGGWPGATGPSANMISMNADLQREFTKWSDTNSRYLNPAKSVAEAWTSGTGNTGIAISAGSASVYTGTDAAHPSPYGGVYTGQRLAAEMLLAWDGRV